MNQISVQETLAIDGGEPLFEMSEMTWPLQDEAVLDSLQAAFRERRWGLYEGESLGQLRLAVAEMAGAKHAWLCSSGTIAVELALRGLHVGSGDEVLLAAYDFPGNFRAIEAVGGTPVLVDIDKATWSFDSQCLSEAVSERTKAILVSHLHGGLAPIADICRFADERGLLVVEDACQCPGARVAGRPVGSWGDVGVFSFGGSKLLSAGRGGALVTSREDVSQRVRIAAERGNDAYPLSELQASVLLPQLTRLEERNRIRREAVERLSAELAKSEERLSMSRTSEIEEPTYYKVPFLLSSADELERKRDWIIEALRREGVIAGKGFRGFAKRSTRRCRIGSDLRDAISASERTVLLHHPVLLSSKDLVARLARRLAIILARAES